MRKPLWSLYSAISTLGYTNPERGHQMLDEILAEGLEHYTAPPDLWHNCAMEAARMQHREAQLALIKAGLQEWPDEIDLLCDELQLMYTTHYAPTEAAELWKKLETMDRRKSGPYWRFWVFGAIYHAFTLNDRVAALALLDEGLRSVRRDTLMNVLRTYRRVLVDSAPEKSLECMDEVREFQHQLLELLEERYKLGIKWGVENSYVLATELARLYQERSGINPDKLTPKTDTESSSTESSEDYYLNRALEYLEFAEKLYTGNPYHPIWEIYEVRARVLMAQRRYVDALRFLRSLPESRFSDPSIAAMLKLASAVTGEKIDDLIKETSEIRQEDVIDNLMAFLYQDGGRNLLYLAQQNPALKAILVNIARQLEGERRYE